MRGWEDMLLERPHCVSCRFFRPNPTRCFGTCWHPNHQLPGLRITVRALELNCYRGFGQDDWMPTLIGEHLEPEDILISERPAPFRKPWADLPWHETGEEPAISARD